MFTPISSNGSDHTWKGTLKIWSPLASFSLPMSHFYPLLFTGGGGGGWGGFCSALPCFLIPAPIPVCHFSGQAPEDL